MVIGVVGLVESVADAVSVGLLVTARDGRPVWANRALRDLVGADRDESVDPVLAGLPLPDPSAAFREREGAWTAPDGGHRWLNVKARPLNSSGDGNGKGSGGMVLYEIADVTGRHEYEERAHDRESRLSRVEALAKVGTWEWDLNTDAVEWSNELLNMFGYPPGTDLDYHDYRSMLHPEDIAAIESTLAEALKTAKPFTFTHRMYDADRMTQRWLECYGEVITDEDGRPVRVLGTAHDITEQRRIQEELAYLAEHDPLTSLPNRRSIAQELRKRIGRRAPTGALLLLDIDAFKDINDLRGHMVGDHVLRALAPLLVKWSDPRALLGRIGGDEFAILLPDGDAAAALSIAEGICDAIGQHLFVAKGYALRITVSIGVAPLGPARDSDVLLANADLALQEAKQAGRNRATLFAPEQYQHAVQRVSTLQRVHDALEGGLMQLDAQPIVDLSTRAVMSYELLIRLRDGIEPALGPSDFLPSVERTDLMLRLDRWVIARAVAVLASDSARRTGLHLEVNVSSRTLGDPSFGDHLLDSLKAANVEPSRLGIEVTESAAITSLDACRRLAERLTVAGSRFILDDFGVGFGSFVYLKRLPFTAIKIAGEFVQQVDRMTTDTVLVESVVRAARGLGMRTIAEYVDRSPLVETLRRLGVDQAQGFHVGRPRPLAELVDL